MNRPELQLIKNDDRRPLKPERVFDCVCPGAVFWLILSDGSVLKIHIRAIVDKDQVVYKFHKGNGGLASVYLVHSFDYFENAAKRGKLLRR